MPVRVGGPGTAGWLALHQEGGIGFIIWQYLPRDSNGPRPGTAGWLALHQEGSIGFIIWQYLPRGGNGARPGPPARTGTPARQVTLHYTHITPTLHPINTPNYNTMLILRR